MTGDFILTIPKLLNARIHISNKLFSKMSTNNENQAQDSDLWSNHWSFSAVIICTPTITFAT